VTRQRCHTSRPSSPSSDASRQSSTPDSESSSRKERKRTSFAFNHMPNKDPNTKYFNAKTKALEWRCRYCNQRYALNGGTWVLMNHLSKEHDITGITRKEASKGKRQLLIEESISTGEQHPRLRRRLTTRTYLTIKGDPLEILLVRLLASGNLPTRTVESDEFRDLIYYLNRDADDLIPRSYNTVKNLAITIKESAFPGAQRRLHSARLKIHLSVDVGLIDVNNKSVIAIVTHYIAEDRQLKTMLLSLKEVFRRYTGETLAKYVIATIVE
jgi:hypothetical protein